LEVPAPVAVDDGQRTAVGPREGLGLPGPRVAQELTIALQTAALDQVIGEGRGGSRLSRRSSRQRELASAAADAGQTRPTR
jgi:hypothetical protein